MRNFFAEGGFAMFFVAAFGLATLGAAGWFARSLRPVSLRVTLGLGVTTLFSTCTGIVVDFAAVGHGATRYLAAHSEETLHSVLLQGLAEALAPGVLGFTLLSLAALLVTLGLYRDPRP